MPIWLKRLLAAPAAMVFVLLASPAPADEPSGDEPSSVEDDKTAADEWPIPPSVTWGTGWDRLVEAPLMPAENGARLVLDVTSLATKQAFNNNGDVETMENPYNLLDSDLFIEYGVVKWLSIYGGLPFRVGEIGETRGGSIGDAYGGFRVGLVRTEYFDLALGFRVSIPTGVSDVDAYFMDEELNVRNFMTGYPSYAYYPEALFKFKAGNVALAGEARWVFPESDMVNYEGPRDQGEQVEADFGDGFLVNAAAYYQITDNWLAGLETEYQYSDQTIVNGNGLDDRTEYLRFTPMVGYQGLKYVDLFVGVGYNVSGKNAPAGAVFSLNITSFF